MDGTVSNAQPIEKLNFEAALGELEEIVRALESGRAPLEESIQAYERGIALKTHCESKLAEARLKIEKITHYEGGKPPAENFDINE